MNILHDIIIFTNPTIINKNMVSDNMTYSLLTSFLILETCSSADDKIVLFLAMVEREVFFHHSHIQYEYQQDQTHELQVVSQKLPSQLVHICGKGCTHLDGKLVVS